MNLVCIDPNSKAIVEIVSRDILDFNEYFTNKLQIKETQSFILTDDNLLRILIK